MNGYSELNQAGIQAHAPVAMKQQPRVLVIEDDESVSRFLKQRLESDGYRVLCAADEVSAAASIESLQYEMVLLDLNLPASDGVSLLKQIRVRDHHLPILVLTGRTDLEDRVKALDLGADDYVAKPFEYGELVARIRALLRRAAPDGLIWRYEDVEMNRIDRTVTRAGQAIDLTGKEFALLEYLLLNAGQRLSRTMIMEHVWKLAFNPATNVVDVYINYLRNKVDRGFEHKLIRTVRGVGYQLGTEPPKGKSDVRN